MRSRGFSLIELLAVVALITLFSGLSVAGVNRLGRYRAASDLGLFNSFVRANFMRSMRNREHIRLAINMKNGSYWAEKSEEPFFLLTGEAAEKREEENDKLIERMESGKGSDPFAGSGAALSAGNLWEKAKLLTSEEELENSDYYNYENFIPDRRSLKQVLKPEFEKISSDNSFSKNLVVTAFFAYHTPEIVTRAYFEEKEKKEEPVVHIYIFPEGRIEPFYLAVGEETQDGEESFNYITSDMFLNIKVASGGFEDVVVEMKNLFEDEDAEGKS